MILAAPLLLPEKPSELERLWGILGTVGQVAVLVLLSLLLIGWILLKEIPALRGRSLSRMTGVGLLWVLYALLAAPFSLISGPLTLRGALVLCAWLVLALIGWWLRGLLSTRGGRRTFLWIVTVGSLTAFSGLFLWTTTLESGRGSVFVFTEQLIRVCAALSGAVFVQCMMFHLTPWALDLLERGGFVQFAAARHFRAGKSNFLTAISFLSILGVGVSSFALCGVISVMTGFGADLKRKILGNNAHVQVQSAKIGGFDEWRATLDAVRITPGVAAATPVVSGEAMGSSRTNTAGVLLKGIDLESIASVIDLADNIEVGHFEYLKDEHKLANLPPDEVIWLAPGGQRYLHGRPTRWLSEVDPKVQQAVKGPDEFAGVILGRELAKTLHVYVGEELTLVSPLGDLGPMGVMPRSRRFRVAAIFYSGMYEYDASYAYVKLDVAQDFLDLGHKITDIDAKVESADDAPVARQRVEEAVARTDVRVRDWQEMNRQLFSALKLEKIATFIILSIAIMVASFCIICTLLLMVTEKSKEIAILKSLGAGDRTVLKLFMVEGMIIGAIGTVDGVLIALALMMGLKHFGVRLDPDVYYVDRLPINVEIADYFLVALCSMVITTLATIYPAIAASRLRPVEGIRYE